MTALPSSLSKKVYRTTSHHPLPGCYPSSLRFAGLPPGVGVSRSRGGPWLHLLLRTLATRLGCCPPLRTVTCHCSFYVGLPKFQQSECFRSASGHGQAQCIGRSPVLSPCAPKPAESRQFRSPQTADRLQSSIYRWPFTGSLVSRGCMISSRTWSGVQTLWTTLHAGTLSDR